MMSDIVERLNLDHSTLNPLHKEAADEITRLRQLLSEAEKREREGLQRIANMADTEAARLLERWSSDQGATPETKAAGVASHLITDFGAEVLAMLSKLERRTVKTEGL